MVKKDQEIGENKIFIGIIKNTLSTILLFCSISLILILITFNPVDQGWGVISDKSPTNIYNETGAWLSGLIIKEFGILPGLLLSLVLFIWSLKIFNSSAITFLKTKLLAIFFVIILSSLGGTYLENIVVNTFNLNFSVISQSGMSEWLLTYFSNIITKITGFQLINSELTIGVSSLIISLILFIWILSLDTSEIKFVKFVVRPFLMPLLWIISMFYNLFFVVQKNNENTLIKSEIEYGFFNYIRNKLSNFNKNIVSRKKPKIRKNPILIKNNDKNNGLNSKFNRKDYFQDTLPLNSESGFILPSVKLLKNLTEDIKPPSKETLDLNAKVLEGVLSDYSINGNIDSVRYGPVVTRYDLQPAPGLRSQRVISLADDIARSMSVEAVRVAMVLGQNLIGIELPNKFRETVILRNIMEHLHSKLIIFFLVKILYV